MRYCEEQKTAGKRRLYPSSPPQRHSPLHRKFLFTGTSGHRHTPHRELVHCFFLGRRDKSHRCQAGRFGRKTPRAGEPWSLSLVSLGAPSHGHIPSRFSVGKERRRGKTWGFAVRAFVLRAMSSSSHRFERGREKRRDITLVNGRFWCSDTCTFDFFDFGKERLCGG
jgi:hypothetical protein